MSDTQGNHDVKKETPAAAPSTVETLKQTVREQALKIEELLEQLANPIGDLVKFRPNPNSGAYKETKKLEFLREYPKYGGMTMTARAVGLDPSTVFKWRQSDPTFAEAFNQVDLLVHEDLRRVLIRRAKERSDIAAMFLLKGAFPEQYNDRMIHHHEVNPKIIRQIAAMFADASKRSIPEFCPHCNTALGLTQKFVKELEALTASMGLG